MYALSAVATPMMVDPMPNNKARMSLVETATAVSFEPEYVESTIMRLTHCSCYLFVKLGLSLIQERKQCEG